MSQSLTQREKAELAASYIDCDAGRRMLRNALAQAFAEDTQPEEAALRLASRLCSEAALTGAVSPATLSIVAHKVGPHFFVAQAWAGKMRQAYKTVKPALDQHTAHMSAREIWSTTLQNWNARLMVVCSDEMLRAGYMNIDTAMLLAVYATMRIKELNNE